MKTISHMLEIIRAINQYKAALLSLISALFGSIDSVFATEICNTFNTTPSSIPMLQNIAWVVAIGAGIVSIINGIDKFIKNHRHEKNY